jgi:hypothetical protein
MKRSILDPQFKYVPAAATDIRKTFQRIRKQQAANKAEAQSKTIPMRKTA